ncbi:MAG: hypothetical protein H7230_04110 [Candidatus Parcubacteria bacterium]|nr:hypothetical protein [Candidatus Paceibacterota bacterium]
MDTPSALCLDLKLAIARLRQKERLDQEFISILYQFIYLPLVISIFDEYGLSRATVQSIVNQLSTTVDLGNQGRDQSYKYKDPFPERYSDKVESLDTGLIFQPDLSDTGPENLHQIYNYCLYRLYFMLDFRHVKGFSSPLQLIEHPSSPIEHIETFCYAIHDQVNLLRIETAQITLAKMIALKPTNWYNEEIMYETQPELAIYLNDRSLHRGGLQLSELRLLKWQVHNHLVSLDIFFVDFWDANSSTIHLRTANRGKLQSKLEKFILGFKLIPPPVLRDNQTN